MHELVTAMTVAHCKHTVSLQPEGLAVISVGNYLRQDDGIASMVLDQVSPELLQRICRFDLGPYTGHLKDTLVNHKGAIIVDATYNKVIPGTVSIVDLSPLLSSNSTINIQACHGISLLDELKLAQAFGRLPAQLLFFGIEVESVEPVSSISKSLHDELPKIVETLTELIRTTIKSMPHA